MFKKLIARLRDGRQPAPAQPQSLTDEEIMQNVYQRLTLLPDGLDRPSGSQLRSIPGAIVKFFPVAGMVVPNVYDATGDRMIGSILPDGKFVYPKPRQP